MDYAVPRAASRGGDRALELAILAFMVVYYSALMTGLRFDLLRPLSFGMTFNSMLDYMLHGRFDVDPLAVGLEGYGRDGRVYAYWGPFCALLRLPLLAIPGGLQLDVTVLSCVAAVCVSGWVKLKAVLFLRRHTPPSPATAFLFICLIAYFILAGPQIAYSVPSIYQEPVAWAYTLAAIFVCSAVRGLVRRTFSTGLLSAMAVSAALALLTRASTGIGLYAALAFLLLVLLFQSASASRRPVSGLFAALFSGCILVPSLIAIAGAVITGTVNYYRWGNPFTFQNFPGYLFLAIYPDRLQRYLDYGFFNLSRIPFSLMYFFVPIWPFRGPDGHFLFEATQVRLFDDVELPPSSFFLTDLLPFLLLALVLSVRLPRLGRLIPLAPAAALSLGLFVPWLLMLAAWALTQRYRLEFYPEIDFVALLAAYVLVADPALAGTLRRWRTALIAGAVVSVLASHAALVLFRISGLGPAQIELRDKDLGRYYLWNAKRLWAPPSKPVQFPGLSEPNPPG